MSTNGNTTPPATGEPSPNRRAPAGPPRPVPGGPLPGPDEVTKSVPHRRRRNVPTPEELQARASKINIPGLIVFPESVEKTKCSSQGRYLVITKCEACSHEMPQVLTALEQGKRKKCRCQGSVRDYANQIRYILATRYHAMVQRCHRTTHVSDANYRGRGIEVHFTSTNNFIDWAMNEFPEQAGYGFDGWDFDRIDNDGHYCRDNLRLVNRSLNLLNRRKSKHTQRSRTESFMEKYPDVKYSIVTVKNLIQQGLTDKEILERHTKNAGSPRRPRSSNPKFRTKAQILAGVRVVYPISHPKHGTNEN